MTPSERISRIIENEGLNAKSFSEKIGFARPQAIYDVINGKAKSISQSLCSKIISVFSHYSKAWLLTGEGEMYKDKGYEEQACTLSSDDGDDEKFFTYLLPVAALAGQLTGFDSQGVMSQDCERVISPVADVDFAMPVIGDSMEPEYPSGSRVMVKRIFPDDFISWGNVFVLDTTNGPLIKEVQPSDLGENYIKCVSHNPSGRYKPFDVPLSSVRAMYRVVACVSLK